MDKKDTQVIKYHNNNNKYHYAGKFNVFYELTVVMMINVAFHFSTGTSSAPLTTIAMIINCGIKLAIAATWEFIYRNFKIKFLRIVDPKFSNSYS